LRAGKPYDNNNASRASQSGVALRFPPQSMTRSVSPWFLSARAPLWNALAKRSGDTAFGRATQLKMAAPLVRAIAA